MQLLTIGRSLGAVVLSRPGMAQNVSGLEICSIRGFLKQQVFRKMRFVIADVKARQKHVLRLRAPAGTAVGLLPEHAETPELFP